MAVATRRPPAKGKKIVTPEDLRRVARDVNENVVIERTLVVREIVLTALSGTNLHLLGHPGIAKSLALRAFAQRIVGANYFEIPFNEEIGTDEFYGPPDIPRLTNEGVLVRNPEFHAPWAHVTFADEMFRSNGVMQNALLPYWNVGERHVKLNGHLTPAPLLFGCSASNTLPDRDDRNSEALMSRITTMLLVERLTADGFKLMLDLEDHAGEPETITLAQLQAAQEAVRQVRKSPQWKAAYSEMRQAALAEGLDVDDRRLRESIAKMRANAWLGGRDELVVEDIVVVENVLWRDPEERNTAHEVIKPYFGRFEQLAIKLREEADEPLTEWRALKPKIDALANQDDPDLIREAILIGRRLWATAQRVLEGIKEAAGEGGDTASMQQIHDEIDSVRNWYDANGLPSKLGPTT